MTCEEARQLLHAYVDDELDVATALQFEKHLKDCPACEKQLASVTALSAGTRASAAYCPASAAFRERLTNAIRAETTNIQPIPIQPRWQRRILSYGMAAALLLAIGAVFLIYPSRSSPKLVAALVDSHVRSLQANHLFDMESTDQHTVKPWFTGKLDFSPPVIDLSGEGFPLVGGRLDYVDQMKVASLVFRRNKHVINLFIWPGEGSPQTDSAQGFNLIRFETRGMVCWAVSDVDPATLQKFVDLFKLQKPASTRF